MWWMSLKSLELQRTIAAGGLASPLPRMSPPREQPYFLMQSLALQGSDYRVEAWSITEQHAPPSLLPLPVTGTYRKAN